MAVESTPVEKVFQNDLLREMILDHAIHHGDKEIDRPSLCSVRLVHRTWKDSVTQVLQNRKQPLFQFVLDRSNSVNGTNYVNENGKLLDQFVDAMANRDHVPTFKLKILEDFFREENVSSLARCWKECGDGLVELEMVYPLKGSSFQSILPIVTFPKLSMMRVVCSLIKLRNLADDEELVDKWSLSNLLNSLLADTPSLTDLVIEGVGNITPGIPKSCKHISLPSSLTNLDLSCVIASNVLEGLLIKNELPNLKKFRMCLHVPPLREGLLFQVLDGLKDSLQIFTLYKLLHEGASRQPTYFQLPVMKKLTNLEMWSINCELANGVSSLEQFLPELKVMELGNQSVPMLRKWMESSTFSNVQTLSIETIDENFKYTDWSNFIQSLDAQICQQIQITFPNVSKLQLIISTEQTCGLKYIFIEMRQLTSLELVVAGSEPDLNSDFWDSLLIGAPIEVVAGLRANPCFWGNVQLDMEQFPAFNNLRDLESFSLAKGYHAPAEYKADSTLPPLISDLAFHFAFLKMARLETLELKHRFEASERMTEKWRSLGRTLVYTPWENQ